MQRSSNPSTPSSVLPKLFFTVFFILNTLFFQIADVWSNHFNDHSWIYIPYSILKITSLVFLAMICHAAGKVILSGKRIGMLPQEFLFIDLVLFRFFSGASLIGLYYFIAGYIGAYYYITSLIVTVPLIYSSYQDLSIGLTRLKQFFVSLRPANFSLLINIAIVSVTVLSLTDTYLRGANTPTLTADVDIPNHYLNFYYQALNRFHGWWPTNHLLGFYYLKGSGVYFLGMGLTDVHGASLVGYLFYFFTLILFYRFISLTTNSNTLILFGGLLFTLSRFNHIVTYYKTHIMINSMAIFAMYSSILLLILNKKSRVITLALIAFGIGFPICYPTMAIFTSFLIFICIAYSFLTTRREAAGALSALVIALLVSSAVVFIINNKLTGVYDYSMRLFDSSWDLDTFSKWMDPANLRIQLGLDSTDGKSNNLLSMTSLSTGIQLFFQDIVIFTSPYDSHLIVSYLLIIFIILTQASAFIFPGIYSLDTKQRLAARYIALCGLVYFTVLAGINHMALNRAFLASSFLCVLLFTSSLSFASSLISSRFHFKHSQIILTLLCAAAFTPQFMNDIRPADWPHYFKAFSGKFTLLDSSEYNYPTKFYYELQNSLPKNSKVLLLTASNGALTIPDSIFQLGYSSDIRKNTSLILYSPPNIAIDALKEDEIHYAVIDTRKPLIYMCLSPIFNPDTLFDYWKILTKDGHFIVLELSPGTPNIPDNDFLTQYRKMLHNIDKSHLRAYDKAHPQ